MKTLRAIALIFLAAISLAAQPVRYDTVPDNWKRPIGPYVEAPGNCGGGWYYVSPFNQQPWLKKCDDFQSPTQVTIPPGFEGIFGPAPKQSDFSTYPEYQRVRDQWLQDLKYFKQSGVPEWVTSPLMQEAFSVARAWKMGDPKCYEGRYGWMCRFSTSQVEKFEIPASLTFLNIHQAVAIYQVTLANVGVKLGQDEIHPFVSEHIFGY